MRSLRAATRRAAAHTSATSVTPGSSQSQSTLGVDEKHGVGAEDAWYQGEAPSSQRCHERRGKSCEEQRKAQDPEFGERLQIEAMGVARLRCIRPKLVPRLFVGAGSRAQHGLALELVPRHPPLRQSAAS